MFKKIGQKWNLFINSWNTAALAIILLFALFLWMGYLGYVQDKKPIPFIGIVVSSKQTVITRGHLNGEVIVVSEVVTDRMAMFVEGYFRQIGDSVFLKKNRNGGAVLITSDGKRFPVVGN